MRLDLIASRSFHALDSEGRIYVWGQWIVSVLLISSHSDKICILSGTLDGTTTALPSDGFSDPAQMSKTPLRLDLPAPTRTVR